jgi:HEAT repeat protein/sugar phosphate permease
MMLESEEGSGYLQDVRTDKQSEDPGPPPELNRLEVLHGLRVSIWEACYATVWSALTTGAFLTGYALWLGADSRAMGFVTAIPIFAGLIQLVASYVGERREARRPFVAGFAVAGRTLFLPILLLPLIVRPTAALAPFLALFALSYVLLNFTSPAWTSWMSDLVPPDHRGRYFARRNMVAGVVGMVIGLPAAWFLDYATKQHHWQALGFGVLFGIAVVGGLLSFGALLRQPEPPRRQPPTAAFSSPADAWAYYRTPFADRNFRSLIVFNTLFGLGQNFAAPFFTVYALQNLQLNYVWLQIFATLTSVAGLASMPLWGYLTDRFGNKPLLALAALGTFVLPLVWIPMTAHRPGWTLMLLTVNNLMGGLFWAGVGLAQFNLLIRLSPSDKTPVYVAAMSAVTGLAGGMSPLLGGQAMHLLEGRHLSLFGFSLSNFHITFAIAAFLRLFALIFLRPVVDAGSLPARDVLQQLGSANPRAWNNIRKLQRGGDAGTRLRATEELASSRTRLATGELEAALHDPNIAVREEAARALGEIADPGSVDALLRVLEDPLTGLAVEASHALGRIGDRRAQPALAGVLTREDEAFSQRDRMAAARALGDLGGQEATDVLLHMLERIPPAEEEEMTQVLVRALGQTGDRRVTKPLVSRLLEPQTPRSLRLTLCRTLGEQGDPAALPALRETLHSDLADAALLPALADALAHLKDTESVLPLLAPLLTLESPVARKQVANAIGQLIGEGDGLYGLLSQEEFGRDNGVAKLIQELQRRAKGTAAQAELTTIQDAYLSGNHAACLQALNRAASALPLALTDRSRLCHSLLAFLAQASSPPAEATLLALFALRALLET